jgi:hypothetical protein
VASITWTLSARSGNPVTVMTTALDSPIDNDADLDTYADFELVWDAVGTPALADCIDLYWVRTVDGTNYEDASSTIFPRASLLGAFLVHNTSSPQRLILPEVRLPPRDFKLLVHNQTNGAFASSGNVLKMLTYHLAVA